MSHVPAPLFFRASPSRKLYAFLASKSFLGLTAASHAPKRDSCWKLCFMVFYAVLAKCMPSGALASATFSNCHNFMIGDKNLPGLLRKDLAKDVTPTLCDGPTPLFMAAHALTTSSDWSNDRPVHGQSVILSTSRPYITTIVYREKNAKKHSICHMYLYTICNSQNVHGKCPFFIHASHPCVFYE